MRLPTTRRSGARLPEGFASGATVSWQRRTGGLVAVLAMAAFSFIAGAGALGFALNAGPAGPRITAAVIALLLAGNGFALVPGAWRGLRAGPGPLIEIGPDGLLDRRIADTAIPWEAIGRARVIKVMGRRSLMIEVEPGERARLGIGSSPAAAFNRAFGYPGFTIGRTGIDAKPDDLIRAAARHIVIEGADPHLLPADRASR